MASPRGAGGGAGGRPRSARPQPPVTVARPLPETVPETRRPPPTIITAADGRTGVFISLEAADLTRELPVGELAKVIETLQAELARKEAEIAGLRRQIDELLAPPQTADDFSSALQSTVDELQTELSRLSNPVANFAVKEFRIDTRVGVSITRLGTVEYRFAAPGERVSPEAQSTLSVTLVPVQKEQRGSDAPDRLLWPLRPVGEVAELAAKLQAKDYSAAQYLQGNHVYTVGELLRVGARASIRVRLAAALEVEPATVERWLDVAELLLLRDVNPALATAMRAAGIRGLGGLRDAQPAELAGLLNARGVDAERIVGWQAVAARYLAAR